MSCQLVVLALLTAALICEIEAVSLGGVQSAVAPQLYDVTTANRSHCPESETMPRPPNRVITKERVDALRAAMEAVNVDAYMVLISDDHGVITFTQGSSWDARVEYISGFSGSNGYALITASDAALWTDGRYFLQAEDQLDCDWILMKISTPGHPTGPEWLAHVLHVGAKVGAYPNYVSIDTWNSFTAAFDPKNITMQKVTEDLVDKVWNERNETRAAKPNQPLIIHTITFTGETFAQKVRRVREELEKADADCLVITVLEEVAWLFNLRGSDRTDSLFLGYAIIFLDGPSRLFIQNVSAARESATMRAHLGIREDGTCADGVNINDCITLYNYGSMLDEILSLNQTKIWVDPSASYAVYDAVSEAKMKKPLERSPIALMKAIKNEVERINFKKCILRDSAAVIEFMAELEASMAEGTKWTEVTASDRLREIRKSYEYNMGLSFETISAVGSNAAIIHYRPMPETDKPITTNEVYLLDSGGQYMDGTTDVTRTFHFGTPTDLEKEAYTRVLMGAIDLSMTVWPAGYYGSDLDVRARAPIWQNGWDYNHGTGHGIGYFLSVHEGPGRINMGAYTSAYTPIYEGMFFSDEPGYYEDGKFGIRLETLVSVEKADTPHNFDGKQFLTFEEATLVPFEPHLIKYELLSQDQQNWLTAYHKRCEEEVGTYLLNDRTDRRAYEWLLKRTQRQTVGAATAMTSSAILVTSINVVVGLTAWLA